MEQDLEDGVMLAEMADEEGDEGENPDKDKKSTEQETDKEVKND